MPDKKTTREKKATRARRKVATVAKGGKRKRPVARTIAKALAAVERSDPALRRQAAAAAIDPRIATLAGMQA